MHIQVAQQHTTGVFMHMRCVNAETSAAPRLPAELHPVASGPAWLPSSLHLLSLLELHAEALLLNLQVLLWALQQLLLLLLLPAGLVLAASHTG